MELEFKFIFIQFVRDKILYIHSQINSSIEFTGSESTFRNSLNENRNLNNFSLTIII